MQVVSARTKVQLFDASGESVAGSHLATLRHSVVPAQSFVVLSNEFQKKNHLLTS